MITNLAKELRKSIKKHGIPGASIGVLKGKRMVACEAAGVTNLNTRVPVTTDTVFQIGSITKPFTATMIMQLRDEGRLNLNDKILDHLPRLRSANMLRLKQVTIHHLLKHQSGIDGDFFPPGRQSIEGILGMASMLPSLFEPGTNFSYCNIGFSMLGRVIEILDNRSFDESLRVRIFEPLGMENALSLPEDSLRFRAAVGHVPHPKKKGVLVVPKNLYLSFGQVSAGSTPAMAMPELLKFAAAHLYEGIALNRKRLLARKSNTEMQKQQLRPKGLNKFGLAWMLFNIDGKSVFYHGGATVGQYSFLVGCPQKRIAVAMLTNGGNSQGLYDDIVKTIFESSTKLALPEQAKAADGIKVKNNDLIGRYANMHLRIDIREEGNQLVAGVKSKDSVEPEEKVQLQFSGDRKIVTPYGNFEFGGPKGGPAEWLRSQGFRLYIRE